MYYQIGGEYILPTGRFNSFVKQSRVAVLPILATKTHEEVQFYTATHNFQPNYQQTGEVMNVTLAGWHIPEVIIFMRVLMTNYTIFIHMVLKFSFKFNRNSSTVCFNHPWCPGRLLLPAYHTYSGPEFWEEMQLMVVVVDLLVVAVAVSGRLRQAPDIVHDTQVCKIIRRSVITIYGY